MLVAYCNLARIHFHFEMKYNLPPKPNIWGSSSFKLQN